MFSKDDPQFGSGWNQIDDPHEDQHMTHTYTRTHTHITTAAAAPSPEHGKEARNSARAHASRQPFFATQSKVPHQPIFH